MNNNLINKYQNRIDSFSRNLKKLKTQINLVSLLRLLVFVSGLVSGVLLFNTHISLSLAIFAFALILFLFLLKIHKGLFENKLFFSQLVEINKEEIECLKGNFESFDPGNKFSNNDHPYSSDLDIFGSGSLFQYINRTGTKTGKNILADWLKTRGDKEEIFLRQEAIKELRDNIDLRQKFQATGRNSKETDNDIPEIQKWANQSIIYANSTFYLSLLYILPAITIILFLLSVFFIPVNIPIMLALFQLGIIGINLRKINKHHTQTSKKYNLLNNYSLLINIIENEHFLSEKLLQLKKKLIFSDRSASTNLKNLAKIVDAFDNRINILFYLYMFW